MKTLQTLEQEAKQARDDMRDVMLEEFGIGATMSDRILSMMIRAVQSNIAHNDAKQEVSGDGSGESLPEVSQEYRNSDGWIYWSQPFMPTTALRVDLMTIDGSEHLNKITDQVNWKATGIDRIAAYRIVKGE